MRAIGVVVLVACGGSPPERDAQADAVVSLPEPRIAEPEPPAAPMLPVVACPEGWAIATSPHGFRYCHPFPSGIPTCTGASFPSIGGTGCTPVGDVCPEGEWASEGVEGASVYVRPGALDGDGTMARPYGSIGEAIEALPSPPLNTIMLAKGRYEERLDLDWPRDPGDDASALALVGACPSETILDGGTYATQAIRVRGSGRITIENLHVTNSEGGGAIQVSGGATVRVGGSWIGPARVGIDLNGGSMYVMSTTLRDLDGIGLTCSFATCDVDHVGFDGCSGALRGTASRFTGRDVVAVRTGSNIATVSSGLLVLERLAVDQSQTGLDVHGAIARVSDYWVHDIADNVVSVSGGGQAVVDRVSIEDAHAIAFNAFDGDLLLSDAVVMTPGAPLSPDVLVTLTGSNGEIGLRRVAIEPTNGVVLTVANEARLRGSDITMLGVDRVGGVAIAVERSDVALDRVRIERAAGAGVVLADRATGAIDDISIVDGGDETGMPSVGVAVFSGASLALRRASIERAQMVALNVQGEGSTLIARDIAIRTVRPIARTLGYGRGITVATNGHLDLARVIVADVLDHALVASAGSTAVLEDVRFGPIAPRACQLNDCEVYPAGIGVGVYGSEVAMRNFAIEAASLCGVHRASDGTLTLRDGRIERSGVGLCVAGDLDLGALSVDVSYVDNGATLSATELPVPSPTPPIEL